MHTHSLPQLLSLERKPTCVIGSRRWWYSWRRDSWVDQLRLGAELVALQAGELGHRSDKTASSNLPVNCAHPQLLSVECKLSILREILDQVLHADRRGKCAHLEILNIELKREEKRGKGPQRRGNRLRWLPHAKSQSQPYQKWMALHMIFRKNIKCNICRHKFYSSQIKESYFSLER